MKVLYSVCCVVVIGAVKPVSSELVRCAQTQQRNPPTLAAVIDKEISNLESQLVSAAEAMPEEKFNSSPENLKLEGAEFKGVRTFADQIKHVAADNFAIWAPLTGKPEPGRSHSTQRPAEMKSRAEIIGFLKDSFAFGTRPLPSMTAENTHGRGRVSWQPRHPSVPGHSGVQPCQ